MLSKTQQPILLKSAVAMLVFVLAMLATTSDVFATQGNLNYGSATVDGDPSEWDTDLNGLDFYAYMRKAGRTDTEVTGYLYLRYDCSSETMYAYVNSPDFKINTAMDDESFIKINGSKVVDASYVSFAYVNEVNERADGWEASFQLTKDAAYTLLAHNIFVDGDATDETSSTPKASPISVHPDCDCTNAVITATVCEDTNEDGVCGETEPRFPGLNIPVELVPDTPTDDNPILIGATGGTGQVTFESDRDGFDLPGVYTLQVHDAYLITQGYYATTPNSASFSVGRCAVIEREFGYADSALGAVGDLIWYDVNNDAKQNEWYDHNENGDVDEYVVNTPIPLSQYEWIDINGDTLYIGENNEGEVNKCGIPGVTVTMHTTPPAVTTTSLLGYYRFSNLPLDTTYSTSMDPLDPTLIAGAEAWFNINNDDVTGKCATDLSLATVTATVTARDAVTAAVTRSSRIHRSGQVRLPRSPARSPTPAVRPRRSWSKTPTTLITSTSASITPSSAPTVHWQFH